MGLELLDVSPSAAKAELAVGMETAPFILVYFCDDVISRSCG